MMRKVLCIGGLVLFLGCLLEAVLAFAPQVFGLNVYRVASGSMAPGIPEGSLAYVRETEADIGDVALFEPEGFGSPVLHRIVAVDDGRFVTKGDANPDADAWRVAPGDVIGIMAFRLDGLGGVDLEASICGIGALGAMGAFIGLMLLVAGIAMSENGKMQKRRLGLWGNG